MENEHTASVGLNEVAKSIHSISVAINDGIKNLDLTPCPTKKRFVRDAAISLLAGQNLEGWRTEGLSETLDMYVKMAEMVWNKTREM